METFGADAALAAIALAGPPPCGLTALVAWALAAFGVLIGFHDAEMPASVLGCYRRWRDPRAPDVRGLVLVRPGHPQWRWIALHELGHALTNCPAGYLLADDGLYHACKGEERAADACAAVLALDPEMLRQALFEERLTQPEAAQRFGVPERIIRLRARQLGWPEPRDIARWGMTEWEPC